MDSLLDEAPCGFVAFTDEGTVAIVNQTLCTWLDYDRQALEGRHIDAMLSAPGRVLYQTHLFPLLKLHGHAQEIYLSLRKRNGDAVPVLTNAVWRKVDGASLNCCVFVPMQQRRLYEDAILQAKKAAEAANQVKDKFLSMMSHELRTPLQAISTSAQILSRELHGPVTELQQQDLGRIQRASGELLRLLNDILDFARQDAPGVPLHLQTVSVQTALERAEALVLQRMEAGQISYVRSGNLAALFMRADPDRLQQILLNLLTNAIKFTGQGGQIGVTAREADARVAIEVRDSGWGIAEDQLERIFEPFVQVARDRVPEQERGVGLGLAISRDFARAMGGDLQVESQPGNGSAFTLTLPHAETSSTH